MKIYISGRRKMTMNKKAILLLAMGVIVLTLYNVLGLAAELPHWATICVTILGLIFVACGVFIVIKSKKGK